MVVGLGNPGPEYKQTRHNVGVWVVDELIARHHGRLRSSKELALTDELRVGEHRMAVAFPQTYMNESGNSVRQLVRRFGIESLDRLVVVHDELDLPVGRLKVKLGGGLAGHNGLKSIRDHLKSTDFVRVRIGVGKPPGRQQGADYVLRRPSAADVRELEVVVAKAADAVEALVDAPVDDVMNRFNG
ncbi:MAG: aminoacyl-tRNA hydrolase [Acidimicrobiales bacterium]|nr:aminoacyl-tRNA hydrolase [Acidimicrobiales bacterium]